MDTKATGKAASFKATARPRRVLAMVGVAAMFSTLPACSSVDSVSEASAAADTIAAAAMEEAPGAVGGAIADSAKVAAPAPAVVGEESFAAETIPPADPSQSSPLVGADGPVANRDIVYTASASVEVANAGAAATQLRKRVAEAGGYVLSDERSEALALVTVKVPPSKFDATLSALDKMGKVRSRQVSAADVTAQLVDLDARIRSAKLSRDRMRALMDQAVKVSDVIEIESQLQQRDAQVEQLEGQANMLRHQASLATLSVQFSERPIAVIDDSETTPAEGLRKGWVALRNTGRDILVFLATILPWLPVLLMALLILRFGRKLLRRRTSTRPSTFVPHALSPAAAGSAPAADPAGSEKQDS